MAPATHAFSAPRGPADSFDARGLFTHTFLTLIDLLMMPPCRFSPYFLALAKNLAKTDSESMPMTPIAYVMKPMLKAKTAVYREGAQVPVSYTHLTLPTICSV